MKAFWAFLLLLLYALDLSVASNSPPKVQVYSRAPGMFGTPNTLICHVSGFHPPEITIDLIRNGEQMVGTRQTDLAFEDNWQYHLTRSVPFTPNSGDKFACRVTHMGVTKVFMWESDM
ncbi:beta-2-microglobulin-like [Chelmon rostratus]|uniref:beta-2-microglobulin-like n=1 Tax=Chelmon rostratus TaxID=109905 RepID=UPI001BEAB9ED|nr:beta-2-microglobulin-like [Chelmon rostratus]